MAEILGILHHLLDSAHEFYLQLDIFDQKIKKNEFLEAKNTLSRLNKLLFDLTNPSETYYKTNVEYKKVEYDKKLEDTIKNYISSPNASSPGSCMFVFAEEYNNRFLDFHSKLFDYTISQFKLIFTKSKIDIEGLRNLISIGYNENRNKFISEIKKLLKSHLSLFKDDNTSPYTGLAGKTRNLDKCKIKECLHIIDIISKMEIECGFQLIYYSFEIICRNLIYEFEYLECYNILDEYFNNKFCFDAKTEFSKIVNNEMSQHHIAIASNFFETHQKFSANLSFNSELSPFSNFIRKLILECKGLSEDEVKTRVQMIMACICAYSASLGKLVSRYKDDIDKLIYIYCNFTLIRCEIINLVSEPAFNPIIVSLDFSQYVGDFCLKEILRTIHNEIESNIDNGMLIANSIVNKLVRYPHLPSFDRLFNLIIDICHFSLIRYVYKSLDKGITPDIILSKCNKIAEEITINKPPLNSELRAKSRLLVKILENNNDGILEFSGTFFSDAEILYLRQMIQ